jgi:NAD(P)-dependent dehydrogenase (short-subunit alcohol dehydrogenase family)
MDLNLEDKCVVVTGAGHGIGRAFAERFAAEGARVVVADLHEARAEKIARRIGGTAAITDVGDPDSIADLVRVATDRYGPVDVFVSNAGIGDPGPDLASTREQLDHIMHVNLSAHIWAAQAVVPSMVERGGGHLVQTISSAALITGPSGLGYTVTKHGALGFAEWMALNYLHLGIRVTCLCPNAVNTGMLGRDEDDESGPVDGSDDSLTRRIGDVLQPEECVAETLDAMREGRFLALPHPRVGESFLRKAGDYDRWLDGTNRRLRRMRGEDV